jgi:hypothetical protein
MPETPIGIARALEAIQHAAGRTVVVAGPPVSGKSDALGLIRAEARARQWRLLELRGSYRDRMTAYAALAEFDAPSGSERPESRASETAAAEVAGWTPPSPTSLAAGMVFAGANVPMRSRRTRGDWGDGRVGGGAPHTARRSGRVVSGSEVYGQLLRWLESEPERPVAVLIEDATLFDSESRDVVLEVSEKVRRRPILLAVALDVSLPAFRTWEERLIARGDVDWVRIDHAKPDPREAEQIRESFSSLPEPSRRMLVFLSLLGGSASEVGLARAARLGLRELVDALAPAVAVNLAKAEEGRISIPFSSWIALVPTLVSPELRAEIHRQIAEGISALSPEPDSKRGRELANHLFEAGADQAALRPLLEAAEVSERLAAYDATAELLEKAERCLADLPGPERAEYELEIRLWLARALLMAGRIDAGEAEIAHGIQGAIAEGVSPDLLRSRVDELLPALRAVGPRPSLAAAVTGLADRLGEANARGAQAILQSVVAEYALERGLYDEARVLALRAQDFARRADPETARAGALMTEAITAASELPPVEGTATPFHDVASGPAARVGRTAFDRMVAHVWLRWIERPRHPAETLAAYQKTLPILQRTRSVVSELHYQLAIAELLLDRAAGPKNHEPAQRARELADVIHLIPPAPGLARLWLIEGRCALDDNHPEAARDAWGALIEQRGGIRLAPYQAEAIVRLAALDLAESKGESAKAGLRRLESTDPSEGYPERFRFRYAEIAAAPSGLRRGAGALPARVPD